MFIEPMLLQKAEHASNEAIYYNELKLDGCRVILSKHSSAQIFTRHHNNITASFPELQQALVPDETVLDGEIIVPDPEHHWVASVRHGRSMSIKKLPTK